ncbi:hypothetical protein J6590_035185 [Homalodisca vitripennis]|nr:hypothetical protein J6590_035185 [Homalodisca vitripennis]
MNIVDRARTAGTGQRHEAQLIRDSRQHNSVMAALLIITIVTLAYVSQPTRHERELNIVDRPRAAGTGQRHEAQLTIVTLAYVRQPTRHERELNIVDRVQNSWDWTTP